VLLPDYDANNPLLDLGNLSRVSPAVAQDLDDSDATLGTAPDWALVEGRQDVACSDPATAPPGFGYANIRSLDPRSLATGGPTLQGLTQWYARSEIDLTPPAQLAGRLGHQFLPKCASFKVEFALHIPELAQLGESLWIDPADLTTNVNGTGTAWNAPGLSPDDWPPTRKRIERMLAKIIAERFGATSSPEYLRLKRLMDVDLDPTPNGTVDTRFGEVGGYPMARWYTTPTSNSATTDADPLFPVALRVTVDVFDDEARFARPIRQVMVFEVGR
jgi:hypothetical protein